MTLLQPTDVPSRAGINNAITTEIEAHASTTDPAGQHYDSGWINITLRAGFTVSGETPRYRRIGSTVYLRGRIAGTFAAGNTYIVGDVPAGFRPNPLILFPLAGSSAATSGGRLWVDTSGQINVNPAAAPTNVSVAMSYLNN